MPEICYVDRRFSPKSRSIINKATEIIEDYKAQGYELTLRQLYYQFVSRDLIANNMREYKNLGSVINDGRLAGLINWNAIVDRTRNVKSISHWDSPSEIVDATAKQYRVDRWKGQPCRIEVWIEKDALVGVISGICNRLDIPYFSCRGYTSQSEMWGAAMRFRKHLENEQGVLVLHLGDHDPSGIDMSRDIEDRLNLFLRHHCGDIDGRFGVARLGLSIEQIQKYRCPPNPAKITDSRAKGYIAKYGRESWELDALEPKVIVELVRHAIEDNDKARNMKVWNKTMATEARHIKLLEKAAREMAKP